MWIFPIFQTLIRSELIFSTYCFAEAYNVLKITWNTIVKKDLFHDHRQVIFFSNKSISQTTYTVPMSYVKENSLS